jgi:hypothetical protein
VVIEAENYAPCDLPYSIEHGRNKVEGKAQPHSELSISVPYDPDAAQLVIGCETWRPSDLLGTPDSRLIGLCIRSISLSDT